MPNELNEKLAKWAGFTYDHALLGYRRGDGVWHGCYLPDFCNDLNACFKWLVPKLVQVQVTYTQGLDVQAIVYCDPSQTPSFAEVHGYLPPALALCQATEKVIDA